MARTGLRKLCDVYGSLDAAAPIHDAIDGYLLHHSIPYVRHHGQDRWTDGAEYYRYYVQGRDLQQARLVLPVVRELQERAA